jgi:hypothetical protein
MALLMMAQQFILQELMQTTQSHSFLSRFDIQKLFATSLPSKQNGELDVLESCKSVIEKDKGQLTRRESVKDV